ncbi:ROK family protein [Rhizobium helianthi]|uniref:ROK family protein n=1 Tax=Rhizobium helianthi TaxID=1132695 RepID=A0ABW4M210_9HYPH
MTDQFSTTVSDTAPRMKEGTYAIGIDLGGTKIIGGLADCGGHLLAELTEPTENGPDAPVLQQIVRLSERLASLAGIALKDVAGMVIGIPSAVSPDTGLASLSPNLCLPEDQPLQTLLEQALPFPVTVENDVNLSAFGEAQARPPKDRQSLVFASFGTGVGMGIVIEGKIVRGAFGRAGEIAYLPFGSDPHAGAEVNPDGLFEAVVGTAGIRQRFARGGETVADIFARAARGEQDALNAIEETARTASIGIASVLTLIDPQLIVIGGGIGSQAVFQDKLRAYTQRLLPFPIRMEPSRYSAKAGLMGATALAVDLLQRVR